MKHLILTFLLAVNVLSLSLSSHNLNDHQSIQHQLFNHDGDLIEQRAASGGSIFGGFVLAPFVFFGSFCCIYFNEKRAAIDSRRLTLARQVVQDLDVNNPSGMMNTNGQLIYATGETRTSQYTSDPISGVGGENLIKIWRNVEVLEWRATRRQNDGYQQIDYDLRWVSEHQEHAEAYHNDSAAWFINRDVIYNQRVYLGAYNIGKEVTEKCNKSIPYNPSHQIAQTIMNNTNYYGQPTIAQEYVYFSRNGDTNAPGTLRVSFSGCPVGPLSIVGESQGKSFKPYDIAAREGTKGQTNNIPDCCCCLMSKCYAELLKPIEEILEVHEQHIGKDQIFNKATQKSECFTTAVRIGSFLAMVAGLALFFSPITTILGYIPLVGGVLSGIVGFVIILAAIIICIPLYLLTVAISWLCFHPKIGLVLLGIAIAVTVLVIVLTRKKGGGEGGKAAHMATDHIWHLTMT